LTSTYYKFNAKSVLKKIFKITEDLARLQWESWLHQVPCMVGQCPAERWRTRSRSDRNCCNSITLLL